MLSRLLFICFLQKKRWLNQASRYLFGLFDRAEQGGKDFYRDYLHDLLFNGFNNYERDNPHKMLELQERIGIVPFLNGGLFERSEPWDEPERVNLSNAVMSRVLGEDGLLRRYNFTITESMPYTQEIAVDPEMLGKVFESVVLQSEAAVDYNASDLRKATGLYYTPRIVVHFICREVMRQFLAARIEGKDIITRLRVLLELDAADGIDAEEMNQLCALLSADEARAIRGHLETIKACDPSVGSGAFAVGLLQEFVNLWILCETRERGKDPREVQDPNYLYHVQRKFIESAIYGVDIQLRAIEICKLRADRQRIVYF